jgi:hypothetical protein
MKLKSLILKANDTVKLLLAQPTMIFRFMERKSEFVYKRHTVTEDQAARPDMIALEYYDDQSMTDVLLKFNGISDPFSIAPGDIIMIPVSSIGFYKLERPATTDENPIRKLFTSTKDMSREDAKRVDILKKKYNKETLLPPNVIPAGKKAYKFLPGGGVQFGMNAQTADLNATTVNLDSTLPSINNDVTRDRTEIDQAAFVENANNAAAQELFNVKLGNGGTADETGGNNTSNSNPAGTGQPTNNPNNNSNCGN